VILTFSQSPVKTFFFISENGLTVFEASLPILRELVMVVID
jgi:hypothetical protein